MRRLCLALPAAFLLLLSACSGADVVNAVTPRDGFTLDSGIAYGPDDRQRLDVYEPVGGDPVATVMFFYGGSWQDGSKDDYLFIGDAFTAAGYRSVIPDYRLYPQVRYPSFLEDAAAAVAWARARYDGPLVLVGHSAGAYNAVMLALEDRWLQGRGLSPCLALDGVVGLAGPYDFLPLRSANLEAIFGAPPTPVTTQPVHHAGGAAPPLLLLTGDADWTVRPRNTQALAAARQAAGGMVSTAIYEGIDHIGVVGALSRPLRATAPVLRDIVDFVERRAAADGPAC